MSTQLTYRGQTLLLKYAFGEESIPTSFRMKLVTDTEVTAAINTFSELSELPNGGGYTTGGIAFDKTDMTFAQGNGTNQASATVTDGTFPWTATSGGMPASGTGYTYAVITDGTATDNVIMFVDLEEAQTLDTGQTQDINDVVIWTANHF